MPEIEIDVVGHQFRDIGRGAWNPSTRAAVDRSARPTTLLVRERSVDTGDFTGRWAAYKLDPGRPFPDCVAYPPSASHDVPEPR